MTDDNIPLEDRIGPSGYPGEYTTLVQLPDGNYLSTLSGLQTFLTEAIDWSLLPDIYKHVAKPAGDYTWIPRTVNDPDHGLLFVDLTPDKSDWFWVAIPATAVSEGAKSLDTEGARQFKKIEYMDALEFIGYIQLDNEEK